MPEADIDDIAEHDGDRIEEIGAKRFRMDACCFDTEERQFEAEQFGPARVVELLACERNYELLHDKVRGLFSVAMKTSDRIKVASRPNSYSA